MKKRFFALLVLVAIVLAACSDADVETVTVQETTVIPADKTGVVISNPFKDTTKFDARTITYYSKYDVEYYKISVWYTDALNGAEQTADTVLSTLKISKDDAYTSKTLVFDNEGTYVFKCEAYSGEDLIAEDSATKQLSFANAEFIIFYLVPKIKTQTADVGVSISWVGDDETSVAHTIRFVRPSDGVDTTVSILINGNCVYNSEDYLPIVVWKNSRWNIEKLPLSMVTFSTMVGKIADSYSFTITATPTTEAIESYRLDLSSEYPIFNWTRTYTENNTKGADSFNDYRLTNGAQNGALWVLLDGKIVQTLVNNYLDFTTYKNITAEELQQILSIDSSGNVVTPGDYVATFCESSRNDNNSNYWTYINSDEYVYYSTSSDGSYTAGMFDNTIWKESEGTCNGEGSSNHWHYVIFKAIKTPYTF